MILIAPPDPSLTQSWLNFLTPVMLAILTIVNLVVARLAAKKAAIVAIKTDVAIEQANDNASTAQQQNKKILSLAGKTHTLVNGQYGIALLLILEKSKRIYALSKDPKDKQEITKAQAKLDDHEEKQHRVNSKDEDIIE